MIIPYRTISFSLIALAAGCQTTSIENQRQNDMALVQPIRTEIKTDDTEEIFNKAFPFRGFIRKADLETQSEYLNRMSQNDTAGMEVIIAIDPEILAYQAFPDDNFYVIQVKESFRPSVHQATFFQKEPEKYAVTVLKKFKETGRSLRSNAFGVTVQVQSTSGKEYRLIIENFFDLPSSVRWKNNYGGMHFGLSVRPDDPAFRTKLKDDKIGLAVKGILSSRAAGEEDSYYVRATIDSPSSLSMNQFLLPITVTEVYVVDLTTGKSLSGLIVPKTKP